MEPRIQYATTKDGFNIAFAVSGNGPPLIYMDQPGMNSVQARAAIPLCAAFDERLAQSFQVITHDSRGCGLSTRKIERFGLDELVLDIEAIVDKLQLDEFSIFAEFDSGPPAIKLATLYPDRVKRLVLWCTWARSLDVLDKETFLALEKLVEQNLQLYLETVMQGILSGTGVDPRGIALAVLPSLDRSSLKISLESFWSLDVTDLLPDIKCPSLIMHRQGLFFPVEQSARLAASIPDGRLTVLPGAGGFAWAGDSEAAIAALEEFLLPEKGASATPVPSAFRTILWTDLVGHTEMMRRLGDTKGRDVLREHEKVTREVLKQHGGSEVKTMGDGFLASFPSVTKGVECAIALQKAFDKRNVSAAEPLNVRVGLNAGEPIEEDGDLFGEAVIMAARIAAMAKGGEILCSLGVRELCGGKGFLFADRGEHAMRGFEDAVRVFEISWRG